MIAAFIQARMGSSRLPGKVLMKISGKPVLEHVMTRAMKIPKVDEVIVLTTLSPADLPIVRFCSQSKTRVFCGSEHDVLDRFYQAAKLIRPDHIVRITADCPVIDPFVSSLVVDRHLRGKADYTSNTITETYPDGLDTEIFAFDSLQKAWEQASLPSEREHVTPYIRAHPELFRLLEVTSDRNLHEKRWTLDNREDFVFLSRVFRALYSRNRFFGMEQILHWLADHPEAELINSIIHRNAGYRKSLRQDRLASAKKLRRGQHG